MKDHKKQFGGCLGALLFCAGVLLGNFDALGGDAATLVSATITNNTVIKPRTIFTQTWTMKNTGTTTWTANQSGYTLRLTNADTLGAVPFYTNTVGNWYTVCATINGGKSVATNGTATFKMSFIAPELAGTYTDLFQMYNPASSNFFGPVVATQIIVSQAGSTNQYDRARAISYANNYAGYVNVDGYFWTNGSYDPYLGPHAPVPTAELGDDCAHFVSSCIGSNPQLRGGGLYIYSRTAPCYGEPGVAHLVDTDLIAPGYAVEVASITNLLPGDIIVWNWEGDTNIANLDHATLYLGNGLLASHSESCVDVSPAFFGAGTSGVVEHFIHIYDAPTIAMSKTKTNMVLSWGTNWTGYSLYWSTSLNAKATWTKVSKSPTVTGGMNMMTNTIAKGTNSMFYRLVLP